MRTKSGHPPVVQAGQITTIMATGIAALDIVADYVQVTFCFDQRWGCDAVQEREISGRVVMTPHAWEEFQKACMAIGFSLVPEAERAH